MSDQQSAPAMGLGSARRPEAIEVCPAFMPDLVLLDINMPSMDGITACVEIRKQNKRNFPIIMVTSVDDAVSIQKAFDAGATDFILKPVNWPLFQRLLEKVAPEQVMLVSRNGTIIDDLKHRPETGRDRVIIVVQNVSADKETQSEIYDLAFYDSTTDLPNRHLFERCAKETLIDAGLRDRTVVFVSLCFDNISEEELADRNIMLTVARRLRECLANCNCVLRMRESDNLEYVARIDSNRFMLTLSDIQTADDVSAVCDQIAREFAKRIVSDSGSITISPRLGVATYPADGPDFQTIMHASDSAMRVNF